MARRARVEVEGGLYHLITRGNDRQDVFHCRDDYLILNGHQAGATFAELAEITGLDSSNVSRRFDAAKQHAESDQKLAYARDEVEKRYRQKIAESQV